MAVTAVDNHELIAQFMPAEDDGDTFLYTELLDRSRRAGGSNRRRLLRMFRHASRAQFLEQWPQIQALCDATNCRAYTRLAPRSHKRVGKLFTQLTVEACVEERWDGMSYLYARALGRSTPVEKRWLFDVDEITPASEALGASLSESGLLLATVPSRAGLHYIAKPHRLHRHPATGLPVTPPGVSLHTDNPTNLYIPAGAA